jgi:hypothetical protein
MKAVKKVWYLCDPKKNYPCNKRTCKDNPGAIFRVCDRTSTIDYAKTEGRQHLLKEHNP